VACFFCWVDVSVEHLSAVPRGTAPSGAGGPLFRVRVAQVRVLLLDDNVGLPRPFIRPPSTTAAHYEGCSILYSARGLPFGNESSFLCSEIVTYRNFLLTTCKVGIKFFPIFCFTSEFLPTSAIAKHVIGKAVVAWTAFARQSHASLSSSARLI